MLPPDSDDGPTCAKRSRERLNTLKVFALAALSWTASSLWSALHGCGQFVGGTVANNKDFLAGTAGAAGTMAGSYFTYLQFDEAYRASDVYKIQAAVQDFLKPYQPKKKEEQVVKRNIMNNTKELITEWSLQTEKATIVSGRFQSGKTVAVNEALRGVRGVFQFDVESAGWKEAMYKKLCVNDEGMFKEVLRRVRRELEKFPNNPTKFPILLLEVHREVVGGGHSAKKKIGRPNRMTPKGVDAMKLVSTTAKTLATDGVDQAPTHAPPSAF